MVKHMGRLTDNRATSIGSILARKVRREDRVGNRTVDMTRLTMVMVCFRVHVDQWNGQHPGSQPRQDQWARPRYI